MAKQAFHCPFDAIRDHLARDTDGLILIAAGSTAECQPIFWLVQDVCLQKLPPVLLLVNDQFVPADQLAGLDPYVARRLRWPEDADDPDPIGQGPLRPRPGFHRPCAGIP